MGKRALVTAVGLAIMLGMLGSTSRDYDSEAPITVSGACGHAHVTLVRARLHQIAETCSALRDVSMYFSRMGLTFEPRVSILYGVSFSDHNGAWPRSHATFDARTSTIRINDAYGFVAWGITSRGALARSFLCHELVHLAMHRVMGEQISRLPYPWQEFFAYAVQFDLMSQPLLVEILRTHRDVKTFDSLSHVNQIVHGADPERFAILAYKTYVAKGRTTFLKQVLQFEIKLPDPPI